MWIVIVSVRDLVINHMALIYFRMFNVRAMKSYGANLSFNFQTCSSHTIECKYLPVSEVITKVNVFASGHQIDFVPISFKLNVRSLRLLCYVRCWICLHLSDLKSYSSQFCALFFECTKNLAAEDSSQVECFCEFLGHIETQKVNSLVRFSSALRFPTQQQSNNKEVHQLSKQ